MSPGAPVTHEGDPQDWAGLTLRVYAIANQQVRRRTGACQRYRLWYFLTCV
ncbi:hypothetical protein [Dendronalium sp. ChiSLP03b]|uniref:hypothetical protein n=1 Tax=Dendronalium sp. ChiSLP03b TaxID=3075381 RepID=UPI00267EF287|nr:hypothetical protein [Dendronalium sp. ChiSLP03b]MDZ8205213.1 hypothetical protein [Dendronalium sp. ChiSLP03b]